MIGAANVANPDGPGKKVRVLALDPAAERGRAGRAAGRLRRGPAAGAARRQLVGALKSCRGRLVRDPDALLASLDVKSAARPRSASPPSRRSGPSTRQEARQPGRAALSGRRHAQPRLPDGDHRQGCRRRRRPRGSSSKELATESAQEDAARPGLPHAGRQGRRGPRRRRRLPGKAPRRRSRCPRPRPSPHGPVAGPG